MGIINGKAWILANARIALAKISEFWSKQPAKILGETRVALARANSQLKSSSGVLLTTGALQKNWAKQE